MFIDYRQLVLEEYRRKMADLPRRLTQPTPAGLRLQCAIFCRDRFLRKDVKALNEFFEKGNDQESLLEAINQFSTDKFRPMVNFLKERTSEPQDKNVELLAWLIDFEPRPFDLRKKYDVSGLTIPTVQEEDWQPENNASPEQPQASESISTPPIRENALPEEEEQENKEAPQAPGGELAGTEEVSQAGQEAAVTKTPLLKSRRTAIVVVLLLLAGGGVWLFSRSQENPLPAAYSANGGECMYWEGDHYQQVACNQQLPGGLKKINLDTAVLYHLKRITQQDTITNKDIGRVWYVKLNKTTIDCYTADGYYPLDTSFRLRPITAYIIKKYISGKALLNYPDSSKAGQASAEKE